VARNNATPAVEQGVASPCCTGEAATVAMTVDCTDTSTWLACSERRGCAGVSPAEARPALEFARERCTRSGHDSLCWLASAHEHARWSAAAAGRCGAIGCSASAPLILPIATDACSTGASAARPCCDGSRLECCDERRERVRLARSGAMGDDIGSCKMDAAAIVTAACICGDPPMLAASSTRAVGGVAVDPVAPGGEDDAAESAMAAGLVW